MRTLHIFEDIEESTLSKFSAFVDEIPDGEACTLEVTSHGGLVFYGNAIFQKMQEAQRRGVSFTAKVYGLAASSAADIVLACDTVSMASTATIMIHSAWNDSGDIDEGIRIANTAQLSVIRKRLPNYTSKDLREDRWFTADEALAVGLIDSIFDAENDRDSARLSAKYLAAYTPKGGLTMAEEMRKEEMIDSSNAEIIEEEVKEEEIKKEEEAPSIEELFERISERFDAIEERIRKMEEMNAECGDRRDNARLRAVYDKIAAIAKPCTPTDSVFRVSVEDPKAELDKCKSKYPNLDKLVGND